MPGPTPNSSASSTTCPTHRRASSAATELGAGAAGTGRPALQAYADEIAIALRQSAAVLQPSTPLLAVVDDHRGLYPAMLENAGSVSTVATAVTSTPHRPPCRRVLRGRADRAAHVGSTSSNKEGS
jgi:hypothetical protein